ncbi:hypothetical protein ACTXT7_005684 [Hymenolepis weldensis]
MRQRDTKDVTAASWTKTEGEELTIKSIKQKSDRGLTGAMELLVACEVQKNIVNDQLTSLIGWYLYHGSLLIVTEYMLAGTLLEYLLQTKSPNSPQKTPKNNPTNCQWNIRSKFQTKQTYRYKIQCWWSAPEILEDKNNSNMRSDVWLFGVVIWEIYTLGSEPYSKIDNEDLLQILRRGKRLSTPKKMPVITGELMKSCWEFEPQNRPLFTKVYKESIKVAEGDYN